MKPPLHVDEGFGAGDVIDHDDPVGPPIIPVGPGSVSELRRNQGQPLRRTRQPALTMGGEGEGPVHPPRPGGLSWPSGPGQHCCSPCYPGVVRREHLALWGQPDCSEAADSMKLKFLFHFSSSGNGAFPDGSAHQIPWAATTAPDCYN